MLLLSRLRAGSPLSPCVSMAGKKPGLGLDPVFGSPPVPQNDEHKLFERFGVCTKQCSQKFTKSRYSSIHHHLLETSASQLVSCSNPNFEL